MSQARANDASRRPTANDDVPADPIDAILDGLRDEWRAGCSAQWPWKMALGRLEGLRKRAPSRQAEDELRAIEERLRAYRDLSAARRRDELPRIADALKAIAPTLRQLAAPAPPVGRLESALRPKKGGARPAAGATPAPTARPAATLRLDDSVTKLPKVGTGVAKKLANLGVTTIGDLVQLKPRRHVDYSRTLQISRVFDVQPGDDVTVRGEVIDIQ
ncbi:MAG TPA: hypothetical protein VFI22_03870, partial [Thermomicrobiales bacterium]|nr:hypothetical protein [Thermomicrobiales bacterium]